MSRFLYIEDVDLSTRIQLRKLLDSNRNWEFIAAYFGYNSIDVRNFELAFQRPSRSPTEELLTDLSQKRTLLQELVQALTTAQLMHAAKCLQTAILASAGQETPIQSVGRTHLPSPLDAPKLPCPQVSKQCVEENKDRICTEAQSDSCFLGKSNSHSAGVSASSHIKPFAEQTVLCIKAVNVLPSSNSSETLNRSHLHSLTFCDLEKCTFGFDADNIVYSGSNVTVYTGYLSSHDNLEVAIKKYPLTSLGRSLNQVRSLMNTVISRCHVMKTQLVQVIGYCIHESNLYTVSELMKYGTLHDFCCKSAGNILPYNVWVNIAHVLNDLHHNSIALGNLKTKKIHFSDLDRGNVKIDYFSWKPQSHNSLPHEQLVEDDINKFGSIILEFYKGKMATDLSQVCDNSEYCSEREGKNVPYALSQSHIGQVYNVALDCIQGYVKSMPSAIDRLNVIIQQQLNPPEFHETPKQSPPMLNICNMHIDDGSESYGNNINEDNDHNYNLHLHSDRASTSIFDLDSEFTYENHVNSVQILLPDDQTISINPSGDVSNGPVTTKQWPDFIISDLNGSDTHSIQDHSEQCEESPNKRKEFPAFIDSM